MPQLNGTLGEHFSLLMLLERLGGNERGSLSLPYLPFRPLNMMYGV